MRYKVYIISTLFLLLCSSCNSNLATHMKSSPSNNDEMGTSTVNETSIVHTETTFVEVMQTSPVKSTLIPISYIHDEICAAYIDGLPESKKTFGQLFLLDHKENRYLFFNFENGKRENFLNDNETILSFSISPNGEWMAYKYRVDEEDRFMVINSKKENIVNTKWPNDWYKIAYWIDNQRIVINLAHENDETTQLIYNPFDNSTQFATFSSEYQYNSGTPLLWRGAGDVIYDTTLDYVVFPSMTNDFKLANTDDGNILASIPSISFLQFPIKIPQWSPTSNEVIIAAPNDSLEYMNDELFIINKNGTIKRLTNFTDVFTKVSINRYSWSPDGKNIALLFSSKPSNYGGEQLAIINMENQGVTPYCVLGDISGAGYRLNLSSSYDEQIYTGVVWSPKGDQLILENRIYEDVSDIYLIDLSTNRIYKIIVGEDVQPVGWMNN